MQSGMLGADEAPHTVPQRELTILYATETGNAEEVAERIARIAYRRAIQVRLYNVADYDKMDLISETYLIFVVATSGNGEFPPNARPFWRFLLRKNLPVDILSDVTFTTFGLGDSTYKRFCRAARLLTARMKGLGAHLWFEDGEADDQHYLGIDGAFLPWAEQLENHLESAMPLPPGMQIIPPNIPLPPRIQVQIGTPYTAEHDAEFEGMYATVVKNERMTAADHWQDVRLFELDLPPETVLPAYQAGDVVCLFPQNNAEDVAHLLQRLHWTDQADRLLTLTNTTPARPLPPMLSRENASGRLTLRKLLTDFLDPFSVPRRSFFEAIQHFSPPDHLEHEKLTEFLQPGEGTEDMYEYAQRVRRTMAEVLHEFKSLDIPINCVMELFPLMRERQYSIASAPSVFAHRIQLVAALVEYKTRLQKPRQGVCSQWLKQLPVGSVVPLRILKGTLLMPATPMPVLAIGPGTGIAPLRSIIQERIVAQPPELDNVVLTGCRYKDRDCLFHTEWAALVQGRIPSTWNMMLGTADMPLADKDRELRQELVHFIAASRDHEQKVYVQDVLREQGALVWEILGLRRGMAYLCGYVICTL
ncbi:NAPDH-dependent diflavin reductase [Malassezia vespertilionis]|uniref:NAPDH-dependent diflavin reductase n=1 Tax=Malassezia vespertilionis TaxID=2020962 RepID=UPI0024B18297|nr:NAPDH-dependent diflavin reductase [Malassezia vespertilionis]WFD07805.1 NAPDH-dependent diflavin reductase [Malassezia vespertilionis]